MQAQVLPQKDLNQKEKQQLMVQGVAFARVHQLCGAWQGGGAVVKVGDQAP